MSFGKCSGTQKERVGPWVPVCVLLTECTHYHAGTRIPEGGEGELSTWSHEPRIRVGIGFHPAVLCPESASHLALAWLLPGWVGAVPWGPLLGLRRPQVPKVLSSVSCFPALLGENKFLCTSCWEAPSSGCGDPGFPFLHTEPVWGRRCGWPRRWGCV